MGLTAVLGRALEPEAVLARLARTPARPWWRNVLTGLAFATGGLAVRWAGSAFYGEITGFIILLPAVVLAALAGGRTAGLVTTVASLLGGWIIAGPEAVGSGVGTAMGRVATFNFIVVGVFCTLVAASLRKTVARLDGTIVDLERSRAQVDETETRLHDIADIAPVMLWTADPDGRIHANAALRAFRGDRPLSFVDPAPWIDAIHPEDRERVAAAGLEAWTSGARLEIEGRYRRADGVWRTLATTAEPRRDSAGHFIGMIGATADVTEARNADRALKDSEARFRLMADTAPSPVWLTNAEGEVEFVNTALTVFFARPGEALMGQVWKESIHPDDRREVQATQTEARERRVPYGFECRFLRHDGLWRWMRVSVNPRFAADGTFHGYVGLSFDITETREALDALARQERRQRFLLELSDGIRDLNDPEAIMDHVHSVLGRMLGASRVGYGEMRPAEARFEMKRDWTEGVPSLAGRYAITDECGPVDDALAAGRTVVVADVNEDPRTAASVTLLGQRQIGAFIAAPVVRSGLLRAFLHVGTIAPRTWTAAEINLIEDVADRAWTEVERTRAEAERAESEARFRAIADTAPVLVWVTHQDRSRAFVNQAYVDFMGGDYESVRTADWRSFIHPDDQDRLVQESSAGEASGQPFSLEARYRHHSGEYRWLRSDSRPRFGPGGDVIGFVGVAFDVTDARRVEHDLKRINELLEERVGEALAEKARAEADLMHAQRMEAVGRLTGGVAHDFNNLLTVVMGALELILKSPEDAGRRQKLGEAALSAARRGERLTHQLLAFSRRQALRPETVDLNALIRESDPLLRRAVGEAVAYRLKLRRSGARVIVDPAQFEAALLNLIVNARDAVAERGHAEGAAITVQTRACEVEAGEILDLEPGNYVCVTVSDTGVGMDEEVLRRVFEPFFTTKTVGKGTGLGLSQVYGFARQSGGGIRITSTVGVGSEIQLYLPPAPVEIKQERSDAASPAATIEGGQRLLLVEDDIGVATIAVDLLAGLGFKVETAETGAEALLALRRSSFEIMLSDVVMPGGMTGIELARQAADLYPALRIVLTSGYAGDDVDKALSDAPWPFLRKPYSGEELARVLGRIPGAG
ncbi:MAG: PAS domain S-box protein [Brevundimonas sp.]|uniref:PAS domain S-box protein n=1 Tax=Brevundimonas sp. TaxID=1871086 RepID=UPI002732E7CC|nr:PAS domain S-box protein [Brevundimonas sp.]MDP3403656.1 PAS domain S-box protein [Brevundimonas sp.]